MFIFLHSRIAQDLAPQSCFLHAPTTTHFYNRWCVANHCLLRRMFIVMMMMMMPATSATAAAPLARPQTLGNQRRNKQKDPTHVLHRALVRKHANDRKIVAAFLAVDVIA